MGDNQANQTREDVVQDDLEQKDDLDPAQLTKFIYGELKRMNKNFESSKAEFEKFKTEVRHNFESSKTELEKFKAEVNHNIESFRTEVHKINDTVRGHLPPEQEAARVLPNGLQADQKSSGNNLTGNGLLSKPQHQYLTNRRT